MEAGALLAQGPARGLHEHPSPTDTWRLADGEPGPTRPPFQAGTALGHSAGESERFGWWTPSSLQAVRVVPDPPLHAPRAQMPQPPSAG